MKKVTKTIFIICSICISLGIILSMISLALGFGTSQFFDTVSIRFHGGTQQFMQEYQTVKNLKIDAEYADVNIQEYSGEVIKIEGDVSRYFEVRQSEDNLVIDDYRNGFSLGRWIGNFNYGSTFTVYIPADWQFDKVDFSIGAGKMQLDTLHAAEFKLEVGAGQAITKNLDVLKEAKVICGVGSVTMEGAFANKLKLECGVGEITTNVYGKYEDYNYKVDCGIGSVIVGTNRYSGLGSSQNINNRVPNTIEIECGIGSVDVDFKQ